MELIWQRLRGKNAHVLGRELLAGLYREKTGKDMPPVEVTPRGKPCFVGSDLHFSVSHTKNHVFCCLAEENVGVDAEEADRKIDPRAVLRYCSQAEQARLSGAEHLHDALLRLWVLKESYAKLTGRGLGNYLRETDFSPDDCRIQIIDGCYVAVLKELP